MGSKYEKIKRPLATILESEMSKYSVINTHMRLNLLVALHPLLQTELFCKAAPQCTEF